MPASAAGTSLWKACVPVTTTRRGFSFSAPGALLNTQAAQVDGYRLTHELLRAASQRGAAVHSGTRVRSIARDGRAFRVTTEQGAAATCGRVVLATGYESADLWHARGKLVLKVS